MSKKDKKAKKDENLDLKKTIKNKSNELNVLDNDKENIKNYKDELGERLNYLQRRLMELKVPVIIILEGAYASGKGRVANNILMNLDARYTNFYATKNPTDEDLKKPFFDQYYNNIPSYNNFSIFYKSWYSLFTYYKNNKIQKDIYKDMNTILEEIKNFEHALVNDGYVLIKFYLDIDKEKQTEHIKNMLDSPLTTWKAQEYDKANNKAYVEEMGKIIKETDTSYSPWNFLKYEDRTKTSVEAFKIIINILEEKLEEVENKKSITPMEKDGSFTGKIDGPISKLKNEKELTKEEYDKKLKKLQERMREVQYALYTEKIPMVLVFEGWDAAGKGGGIKRIIEKLDPTNYTVNTTAAPNDVEKNHHYLWRFAIKNPKAGHIAIWDRSWYGRVLVERIEGFATNYEWGRAYDELNGFEKSLTNFNAIIIKFFLNISKDTQLERFEARQNNPKKSWKITEEDWRNRDKWDKYTESINDMIEKTSTKDAPWIIIDSNYKLNSRIAILENIIKICDQKLKLINYKDLH